MGDSSSRKAGDHVVELAGKVMVVGIILLFFVVIFFICLHLYFKWFYLHRQQTTTAIRRRRRRLDFAAGHQEITAIPTSRVGLEPSVLKSIPVVEFDPKEFKDGLECAVCLCEVCEGEKARILPKCSHGFHVECIDMWFESHATCPLCRNSVSDEKPSDSDDQDRASSDGPNLPTNVLFWGDDTRVNAFGACVEEDHLAQPSTSAAAGMVVIDVPLQ
ncbi:RING-H2 finger protein ATL60-like [Salvia miltiorrhiza]|uniref:RING-H2 finger protein ATL60-like n=1 Tax=Salvia miltiorrhiza TaxID=226208 RepID=UPI0025AD0507|nr:RING-H2 finger protein ATL60-like [Salvia miltiorrhiza]